jgi:hypothetical protein
MRQNEQFTLLFIGSECKHRWTSLWEQYRKYLKKLTTKSGQSASIKIPKWKFADEMSTVCPYLRERDTVTNQEFDEKGETDEEELLQAEKEHVGTEELEEQTPASAKSKLKNRIFQRTLKHPRYQPEMASTVLMKYLVESEKERQAEPPVDLTHFFKSTAATVKTLSPYQNICQSRIFVIVFEAEMTEILQETKSTHSSECSFGSTHEPGIQQKHICDANSSTSSNMATHHQQLPSQLNRY